MIEAHTDIDFSIPAMREMWRLPAGIRAEVLNEALFVLTVPTTYHVGVTNRISNRLTNHVIENDLGEVFSGHFGIFLKSATTMVIPDVVFVSNENDLVINRKGIFGAPDLVVEVLSPSTKRRDRTLKKQLYEEVGVKEYWLVDPVSKETWGYLLGNGHYDDPLSMNAELNIRTLDKLIRF